MLKSIVHFSLKFRGPMVGLACIWIVYGLYVANHAKLDVFPNFVPPEVEIQTEAPGLVPEEVEVLVTRPLESAINGIGKLEALRSQSISGLSVITAVFAPGSDVMVARQMIAERLAAAAGDLPPGALPPTMSPLTSSTMDLLKIGLVSDKASPMELRTLADWVIAPRLLSVPGVAHCNVFGGEIRELQIQLHPEQLAARDLSINEVLAAARGAMGVQARPLMSYGLTSADVMTAARASTGITGAGFVENATNRILIQAEGRALTPESLGELAIVRRAGQVVRLKDVATVQYGPEPKLGDALIMNKPGVLMAMTSQYGANTMEVTKAVEAALEGMTPMFEREGIKLYPALHRPATFIENSLRNIEHSIYVGAILVAVVLFAFLGHFRTAFISLTAIPLSLLTAIIVLDKFGVTLNTMTLGGLAIAIGEVVDDAIIDVENIFRRLRENEALGRPRSAFRVVLEASIEVRSAVVYATFVVVLVFLPVLTLTGLQGSFFAPLALSYIVATMASLGVALTVTPALSLLFFRRGVTELAESRLQGWLKGRYRKSLGGITRAPQRVIWASATVCIAGVLLLWRAGAVNLLPQFREGHYVVQLTAEPGTSMPDMLRMGSELSGLFMANSNVLTVEQQAGRVEQGEDTWEPNQGEMHVELNPRVPGRKQYSALMTTPGFGRFVYNYRKKLGLHVVTFLEDRISETLTGESAPVVISIYGDDLAEIDKNAADIRSLLAENFTNGIKIFAESLEQTPRAAVRWKPEKLAEHGIRPVEAVEALQAAYQGTDIAQDYSSNRVVDVVVLLDAASRREVAGIGALTLKGEDGKSVPLSEVAEVAPTSGRFSVTHDGARRRQIVNCWPPMQEVGAFSEKARKLIDEKIKFSPGVHLVFSGTAEAAVGARNELLMHSAMAAAGIVLLLLLVTGSWRHLFLILANVPFALVGGVVAVFLARLFAEDRLQMANGSPMAFVKALYESPPADLGLTIGSLVGFVTLFGISMRNSIMLISHFEHLVTEDGATWGLETAIRGASERLVPILMTALVTGLGLLPLAIGSGEAGRELEGPMAVVILGGLVTSTALNLLVLPVLALQFGRFGTKKAIGEEGGS